METGPQIRQLVLPAVLACFMSMMLQAPGVQAGVIGHDDRRAPADNEIGLLRALGLVYCTKVVDGERRRSAGTATIVGGRSTILTAAHIFTDRPDSRGRQVRFDALADCSFRQYDALGSLVAEVPFDSADIGAFHSDPGAPNGDWAVLRTARLLPASAIALPFASEAAADLTGLSVRIIAFHTDVEGARRIPMVSEGEMLSVRYGGFDRLAHTADTGRMSSGAALIHRTQSGEYVVVGVNRSTAKFGLFNLAVPLTPELDSIIRSHAWGQVPAGDQRVAKVSGVYSAEPGFLFD